MRILQLCLRAPYPPADGGTIAMYNMAKSLKKAEASVKILAFNTKKHFVDPAAIPEHVTADFNPEFVYLDASVKPLPAFLNLLGGSSYNVSRFNTQLFRETLEQLLDREEFDVVQMESLFMTPYLNTIRKKTKAKIVLRSHNVEFLIWQRLAASEKNSIRKWYLQLLSERLKKYEQEIVNKFDGIIALTEEDKQLYRQLGCTVPLKVSPIGLDTETYTVNYNAPLTIVHLGSMDWLPNIEGVEWFLDNVYANFIQRHPKSEVFLAGKSMPEKIYKLASENLHIEGRIDDAKKYLSDKQIMIVPLLSGGGMRVKIIEGMAMGKTIISTAIGAEGIHYENNKNILIADSAEAFLEAISKCIANPNHAVSIGREARKLAETIYENKIVGSGIIEFYDMLKKGNNQPVDSQHA
ncbi:MAG: glycosyltransferase family 4 protein [Bacteroidota bacterium]|nr:glycosyltransferase family 4 protein [Bacteroidota bacterium]